MGSTAGSLIGPILGGTLLEFGGYGLPFIVTGGLVALDAAMRVFLLPAGKAQTGAGPDWRALLTDRAILVPALAVAFWRHSAGVSLSPVARSARALRVRRVRGRGRRDVHHRDDRLRAMRTAGRLGVRARAHTRVIIGGVVGMAVTPCRSRPIRTGVVLTGAALCILSAAFAFTLNPTSAELGDAVDRRGMSCYRRRLRRLQYRLFDRDDGDQTWLTASAA